jgi:photosystem II stability/assembly factor-like uncharacterized protein
MLTDLNNALSRTTDGGESWQQVTFPTTEPAFVTSICALDGETAWLTYVEYSGGVQSGNFVHKTIDGGQTWDLVNTGIVVFVNFIYMWNSQEGIVVGDPDDDSFEILKTTDGGMTWNRILNVPSAQIEEYIWADNYSVVGNQLWFATTSGRIYHSPDLGEHWDVWDSPVDGRNPWQMDVSSEGDVYLITYDNDSGMNNTMSLWRTNDSGVTWVDVSSETNTFFPLDIGVVPETGAVVCTYSVFDGVQHNRTDVSLDKGESWVTVDTSATVFSPVFYNAEVGYGSDQNFGDDPRPTLVYKYVGSPLSGVFKNIPLLDVEITVSPNPTADVVDIVVTTDTPEDFWILLNDLSGRLIARQDFSSVSEIQHRIDMKSLPSGTYTLTVTGKEGVRSEKLVKL